MQNRPPAGLSYPGPEKQGRAAESLRPGIDRLEFSSAPAPGALGFSHQLYFNVRLDPNGLRSNPISEFYRAGL
jgi:hypothetical protein